MSRCKQTRPDRRRPTTAVRRTPAAENQASASIIDDEEPLSLAEEIAAEADACPTRSTTATSRSSSRATRTSPSCSGCRWPS